jgi:hypothetical protein
VTSELWSRDRRLSELLAVTLSVLISLMVGIFLTFVPWTTLWDSNYLLQPYPSLRLVVISPFARGTVTGLGLLNIVLAVHEAYQHLSVRAVSR